MNIKILGQSRGGNYHNDGSCTPAVDYNEHELKERPELYKEIGVLPTELQWFDMNGDVVSHADVVHRIDCLTAHLSKGSARFYCLLIDPSDDEARAMGCTIKEQLTNGRYYVLEVMDVYAQKFGRESIRDRHDIVAFAIPHIYKSSGKQQIHWHIVVARKDVTNNYKLSPLTNHHNTVKGPVQKNFDRLSFDFDCEKCFDRRYNYQRRVEDSFAYLLAMKKGTAAEKAEQEARRVQQDFAEAADSIERGILSRNERLAREDEERADKERRAAEEKTNRALFWEIYRKHYKPLIENLEKSIDESTKLHDVLKAELGDISLEISSQYNRLRQMKGDIARAEENLEKADTSEGLWVALSVLVALVNPLAGLVIGFVAAIINEVKRSENIAVRKVVYAQAENISASIEDLKELQELVRDKDAEVMRVALDNTSAKRELLSGLEALQTELVNPLIEKPMPKNRTEHQQSATPAIHSQASTATSTQLPRNKTDVYSILLAAKDKASLDIVLQDMKIVMEPEKDKFGGVTDLKVTASSDGKVVNASSLVSEKQMRQMLDKWESITGEPLSYKLAIQRKQQKLFEICLIIDAAFPEGAPRKPGNIAFLPGGEIDVTYTKSNGNTRTVRIGADGKIREKGLGILDINTGEFIKLQGQRQAPQRPSGISGEDKDRLRQVIDESLTQVLLEKIMDVYKKDGIHYHLVPGPIVETTDGFRCDLYTDGTRHNNDKLLLYPRRPAPQENGRSYIKFGYNDKGEIEAQVESDPPNDHSAGISGKINFNSGERIIKMRDYGGTKSRHDQKIKQEMLKAENVKFESDEGIKPSRIVERKPGFCVLQNAKWGGLIRDGRYVEKEWVDIRKFKTSEVIGKGGGYIYFHIIELNGKDNYINQYGIDVPPKILRQLGKGDGGG